MKSEITGVVHGRMIQLDEEPGLPDGQHVTVRLQPAGDADAIAPGEGIKRAAGAWNDDPEGLDAYLEWNRQQRKTGRRPLES
jgi:hypothetical protein